MKTQCGFSKYLNAYLDGELQEPLNREFIAHIADCPSCSAAMSALRRTQGLLRAARPRELPAGFYARLEHRLKEVKRPRRAVMALGFEWRLAAAALVLCLLFAGAAWLPERPSKSGYFTPDIEQGRDSDCISPDGRIS